MTFDKAMKEPAKAVAFLLGPKVILGDFCGLPDQIIVPAGEVAATTLIERGDLEALRKILREGGTEAQVLALRALRSLGKLRADERARLESLRKSQKTVSACQFDVIFPSPVGPFLD